jgi:hypothetical protein
MSLFPHPILKMGRWTTNNGAKAPVALKAEPSDGQLVNTVKVQDLSQLSSINFGGIL